MSHLSLSLSPVIDKLDTLKKESGNARDAIRWLEAEFRKGNRYVDSAWHTLSQLWTQVILVSAGLDNVFLAIL